MGSVGKRKTLRWVNMSFKRTIASMMTAIMILPLFAPAIAMAAETTDTVTQIVEESTPEVTDTSPGDGGSSEDGSPSNETSDTAANTGADDAGEEPAQESSGASDTEQDNTDDSTESAAQPEVDADAPADDSDAADSDTPATDEQEVVKEAPAEPEPENVTIDRIETRNDSPVTIENVTTQSMSGAVWTTDINGTVNQNVNYPSKPDVFLNGGPNGKSGGGGLPDGEYHWKVTSPNGIWLGGSGAQDGSGVNPANSRTINVTDGKFSGQFSMWPWNAPHSQFKDTPNNGNEYKVWVSQNPQFPGSDTKTDNFKVLREPGVSIEKVDSIDPILKDTTTTYTITVTNTGNTDLDNTVVTDTLPAGLSYVSSTPAPDSISGNTLTWDFDTIFIDTGAEQRIINMVVSGTVVGTHRNEVAVTTDEGVGADTFEYTTVTALPNPEVSITKTDSIDPIQLGDNTTYTIEVKNTGDTTLTGVTVTDLLLPVFVTLALLKAKVKMGTEDWNTAW